ncbi:lysine-specific demethylase 2A-like [Mya arenaria]|uniref:lysine-specific demethylase 2A-like n=1 Tax=Mya arenaria TaxID=6604 RepID=UPI0022E86597|nr:lysine-specific demethylase 2A-like [Mya arenaria]
MNDASEGGRKLRVKERKTYTDHELDDDDIEGKRLYKIEDKVNDDKHCKDYARHLKGEEFNLKYLQENGLQFPILFAEKSGLGLRVPSLNFKVSDVKACVGSRRMLDVMDVNTQKGLEMTMKEWVRYYENTERDRLLNVISLEFSHTKLENYVESPNLVREVDWVDTAWPQHLKDCQTESTNAIDKMKYPKVQKYCLMSVAGCYTDFHIDFGGTSVWYHILHGEKIFWLIPPTDRNLAKYESWVLSGKQGDAFLADSIDECQKIRLVAGNTFIIPSGWIHAVYTPKDSLVFGGNFVHSFNMVNQLKVSAIEDKTHVPMKFRYPFYAEIHWYVLERYVHSLTGVTYLEKPQLNEDLELITKPEKDQGSANSIEETLNKRLAVSLTRIDETTRRRSTSDDDSTASGPTRSPGQSGNPLLSRNSSSESCNSNDMKLSEEKPKGPYSSPVKRTKKHVHLTKYELEGLTEVANWVDNLPPSKRGIPKDLIDPGTILKEIRRLIAEHMKDNPEMAITGEPVLEWTKATKKLIKLKQKAKTAKLLGVGTVPKAKSAGGKLAAGSRRRRVRCKQCEPCTRDDCLECNFCKDMRKYGGPGTAKQSCISRQCLRPVLPKSAVCQICTSAVCRLERSVASKEDGSADEEEDYSTCIMECGLCWEIVHPLCLSRKFENLTTEGAINEDLPNSWKCSKCCYDGKEGQLKTRVFKGGWRPNPTSTPPPLSVSPPPLSDNSRVSPTPRDIITEGKRVTVNQAVNQDMTKLAASSMKEEMDMDVGPDTKSQLMSMQEDRKDEIKDEIQEPAIPKPEPVDSPHNKRKLTQDESVVRKKKRDISPALQKSPRSSKHTKSSPASKSPSRTGRLLKEPSAGTTKRSKRETVSGPFSYDFHDDDDLMDVSMPLPEKGKGKSPKGKRSYMRKKDIKQKEIGQSAPSAKLKHKASEKKVSEAKTTPVIKTAENLDSEQLQKTLLEHIEKRNLPKILPRFAPRPAPITPPEEFCVTSSGVKNPLPCKLWTRVFWYLPQKDLAHCLAVCSVWNRWCINPYLWKSIDLSRKRIVQAHLIGIVRRQPRELFLNAVIMTQKQILWLLERLPHLKNLHMSKCSWATLSGLCMSSCPLLHTLDISWATGLNDRCFEDLVMPPVDRKPAVINISRLHCLKSLNIAGSEISDMSLSLLTAHCQKLEQLNISYSTKLSDRGIDALVTSESEYTKTLKSLDVSGCRQLTEGAIEVIKKLKKLEYLSTVNCIRIPIEKCKALQNMHKFKRFNY